MAYHLRSSNPELDCCSVFSGVACSDSLVCSVTTVFPLIAILFQSQMRSQFPHHFRFVGMFSNRSIPLIAILFQSQMRSQFPRHWTCSVVGGMFFKAYLLLTSWKSLNSPKSAAPNKRPTATESAITTRVIFLAS